MMPYLIASIPAAFCAGTWFGRRLQLEQARMDARARRG